MERRKSFRRVATALYNDRRRARRLEMRLRVDFCPIFASEDGVTMGDFRRAIASDLSDTGLFLSEAGYLKHGVTIHLLLRLPDVPATPIGCYAQVVRSDMSRGGYGVRLLRVGERDRLRLQSFITCQQDRRRRAA